MSVQRRVLEVALGTLALASALGLKRWYSDATATELDWVLAPSCWLASRLGGIALEPAQGGGFVSHSSRMLVGAPCAGVNFLVVAWLALYFGAQGSCRGWLHKLGWLGASLSLAYALTIVTNGLRIVLAARLFNLDFYAGLLSKESLHRLLGVTLYCCALSGLGACMRRARLAPFAWYLLVVLGIPLANRAFLQDPARFVQHALQTLAVVVIVGLGAATLDRLRSGERG